MLIRLGGSKHIQKKEKTKVRRMPLQVYENRGYGKVMNMKKNIIGETLKLCRKYLGIKQKELGKMLGYSEANADVRIAQYESGTRKPNDKTVSKICDILGISEYSIRKPSFESELSVVNILMNIDTLYGLELKEENGDIYLRFPKDCKAIRYYINQLYRLKEMAEKEEIRYDTYQYIKAAFGRNRI